jgi:hypothetical protein
MKVDGLLRWSVWSMVGALVSMIVCLARPTPRTIGFFLGPGLGLGALSLVIFGIRVINDLRARRLL